VIELPLLVELPAPATLVANVAAWGLIHAGTGYAAHRLPAHRLEHDGWLLRVRSGEEDWYRRLGIRRWKDRLPEAGALFPGGISKRHLDGALEGFVRETRRAELAHWWAMAGGPVSALWNPRAGVVLMVAYGVSVNAPFIAVQRYNRARARRILARQPRTRRSRGSDRRSAAGPRARPMGSSMP
jgi:glycosyl-4,4'-diaponeurosporenoate acyltransferase